MQIPGQVGGGGGGGAAVGNSTPKVLYKRRRRDQFRSGNGDTMKKGKEVFDSVVVY